MGSALSRENTHFKQATDACIKRRNFTLEVTAVIRVMLGLAEPLKKYEG